MKVMFGLFACNNDNSLALIRYAYTNEAFIERLYKVDAVNTVDKSSLLNVSRLNVVFL